MHHAGHCYRFWFRVLPAAIGVSIVALLLTISPAHSQALDETQLEQVSPNGVQAGQMFFHDDRTGQFSPALIHASKVHFDISGMVATVRLEQSFRNTSDRWVEGVYAFPLPERAAVRHMEITIGDRRIVGKIKEKSVAKKIYEKAKRAGKKASLVAQQRPNLFTNRVANIGPGEEVTVHLEYVQSVALIGGEFSLRFPMTITPRYTPRAAARPVTTTEADLPAVSDAPDRHTELGWVLPAAYAPDHVQLNRIEISASLSMGMPLAQIAATYHEIALTRNKGLYDIALVTGSSVMDRDFVLSWKPVTGSAPKAAVFTERVAGDTYGLLMLVPPDLASSAEDALMAREIIFVIDTSGSMGGASIVQARGSLLMALNQLRPQDSFNVIEFNTRHRVLFRTPVPATRHYVQKASEFVRQLAAGGGTEMLPALQAALAIAPNSNQEPDLARVRQVIFITDGAIGNEVQLFEEIQRTLGDTRLFTVGIGSAPNSWFMRKAAQFGRGTHTHIGDLSEVAAIMQALFDQISTPLLADIQINWPGQIEAYPARTPDLYRGEPLMVAFKFTGEVETGQILVSGRMADRLWSQPVPAQYLSKESRANPGVASIWAREKIAALLDQKILGKSEELVRTEVLDVALAHSLMSPYTSFVAVEERISRPGNTPLGKDAIPNLRPKGQSPQSFPYPGTATTTRANLFLGCFLLFLTMIAHAMRRPEIDYRYEADDA